MNSPTKKTGCQNVNLPGKKADYQNMSSSSLAFLGDCVFELLVRAELISTSDFSAKKLHHLSVLEVCCQAQAEFLEKILDVLTDEELAVYKRGRNAHTSHTPKRATNSEYHKATGLECLFGHLYLKGDIERLSYLFSLK
ncbi:MAG: ribonuclease III [Oscillospiraceae bacterium]|jgi:ribonuclease-3 family protein|nr:ribonuclease III [Oscillospiraceae bacterium]